MTGDRPIHRLTSDDASIAPYEAKQEEQPFHVLGWTSGDAVRLIVDRVPVEQLQALATHELGHAAGLGWPFCFVGNVKCHHSPDPRAVMAAHFSAAPAPTPSDLAFCRASCLCP